MTKSNIYVFLCEQDVWIVDNFMSFETGNLNSDFWKYIHIDLKLILQL